MLEKLKKNASGYLITILLGLISQPIGLWLNTFFKIESLSVSIVIVCLMTFVFLGKEFLSFFERKLISIKEVILSNLYSIRRETVKNIENLLQKSNSSFFRHILLIGIVFILLFRGDVTHIELNSSHSIQSVDYNKNLRLLDTRDNSNYKVILSKEFFKINHILTLDNIKHRSGEYQVNYGERENNRYEIENVIYDWNSKDEICPTNFHVLSKQEWKQIFSEGKFETIIEKYNLARISNSVENEKISFWTSNEVDETYGNKIELDLEKGKYTFLKEKKEHYLPCRCILN